MINKVNKGRRIELKARKKLESLGYLVDQKNRNRFSSPDFYGMFDLVALIGSTVRFIQVKSNISDFYKARKDIKAWKKANNITLECDLWLYEGRKYKQDKWKIEMI